MILRIPRREKASCEQTKPELESLMKQLEEQTHRRKQELDSKWFHEAMRIMDDALPYALGEGSGGVDDDKLTMRNCAFGCGAGWINCRTRMYAKYL